MTPASPGPDETGAAPEPAQPAPTTYEAARDELVEVVRRLESGGVALDESLALWERGEQLAVLCEQWLDGAKARVESARGRREPDEG